MTLDDLKIFIAACDHGSLSAVAREVGCTQPAVSQHIIKLERSLSTTLFDRSPQGVIPTSSGKELRAAAAESLSALESGIRRVRELSGESVKSLSVTTGGTSVRHFLKRTVVSFRSTHPQVTLSFLPANSTKMCLDLLRDGKAHLALVTIDGQEKGIEHRIYAKQDLRLLVPRNHRLSKRKHVDLKTVNQQPLISLSDRTASQNIITQVLVRSGVHTSSEITVEDFDTAAVFVELGLGIAIIPAIQAFHFSQTMGVTAIRLIDAESISIGLAARRWDSLSLPALDFVAGFYEELQKMSLIPGVDVFDDPRM